MPYADTASTRLATRLSFFVGGFTLACWAPLVPFAKEKLAVDDGTLGMLLLCLGAGSVPAMLLTGALGTRIGSRHIIGASGFGLVTVLPFLAIAPTIMSLGLLLLLFGALLGSLDVAMNIHASEVERAASRPLMSGFHAFFSIGCVAGAAAITLLLSFGIDPFWCATLAAVIAALAMTSAWPRLLRTKESSAGPLFVLPRGIVLLLAGLASVCFLFEGAFLDWSALLIIGSGLVDVAQGGLGYMLFSIAMTIGRLSGDAITARLGDGPSLFWSGCTAVAGLVLLLLAPNLAVALAGFILAGLGAANIIPVLFRRCSSQTAMPASLSIAAITTAGYAGILLGPAMVGFVAQRTSLPKAFWLLAGLMTLIPFCAGLAAPAPKSRTDTNQ